jgi:cell division protein FtsB
MSSKKTLYPYFIRFPLLLSVILLIWMGLFARRGFLDWRRIAHRNNEIGARLQTLKGQKESLEQQVEALQSNPNFQERIVRQTLGFVRKDETVIELE